LIADKASDVSTPERVLWVRLAIGYSLAALSAAIWSTALLLGPLAALHWAHRWRSLRAGCASATRMRWTVLLIAPGMVFLTAVVWPHWHAHAIGAEHAAVWTRHFGDGALDSLFIGLQMLAISLPLVVIGVLALIQLRPAWLAIWMAGGALVVLLSGFYPFRIPYLLVWMAATIALLARNSPPHMAEGLRKLAGIVAMLVLALAGLRVLLAFDNPLPPTGDPWLARLPAGTRVADFGWEFYAPARRRDLAIMRSFPGLEASGVVAWLRAARPDFVLRPAIPQNAWVMVEDADAVFAEGGYCRSGFIDWSGTRVDERSRVRTPPTPALWRLGASRDYGPYVLWAPCGAPGPHSMTMWM
ncbi:MAG: hypothetical protein IT479_10050, partial [Xanthomonadales bacterium]|nr:hypothetical protein [Xanthomonadales bacterium]